MVLSAESERNSFEFVGYVDTVVALAVDIGFCVVKNDSVVLIGIIVVSTLVVVVVTGVVIPLSFPVPKDENPLLIVLISE